MRAGFYIAACCALIGCGGGDEEASVGRSGIEKRMSGSRMATSRNAKPEIENMPRDSYVASTTDREPSIEAKAEKPADKKKRELSAELRQAIGSPAACLTEFSSDAPKEISISVSAVVNGLGHVNRSSISSSHLTQPQLQCIQRQVDRTSIAAPDSQKAENVTTQIVISYEPPATNPPAKP